MIYNDRGAGTGNDSLNPVGSNYARVYNRETQNQVERAANRIIYDASPAQFSDLALFNQVNSEAVDSDEFEYSEAGYQRDTIIATSSASAVQYPNTMTITVANPDAIAQNVIVGTPGNKKAHVDSVNGNTVVLSPLEGDSIDAISAGAALFLHGTIEADEAEGFAVTQRLKFVTRYNYVQFFCRSIRYGRIEKAKLERTGRYSNYVQMEMQKMYEQHRIDMQAALWNGTRGVVNTKDGKAKMTGGVDYLMNQAGSVSVSTPLSSIDEALEHAAQRSEYGEYGQTRFFFASPEVILKLQKAYKNEKTRYEPSDNLADLTLEGVNIGSSYIVFVPMGSFRDAARFPSSWKNQGFLLDLENIKMRKMFNERADSTNDDRNNGGVKNYNYHWVDCDFGLEMPNPLSCAKVTIQ